MNRSADTGLDSDRRPPSTLSMLGHQVQYQLLTFRRSPIAVFFTIGLPLLMLLLLTAILGGDTVSTPWGPWAENQFFTIGLAGLTTVSATYTNLVETLPRRRDQGTLKRWRSTPVPPAIYLGGWIGSALLIAVVGVVLQLGVGVLLFDLQFAPAKIPAMIVTFTVGVCSFAALGLAVASLVPNADAAPAVANGTIVPLAFISDIFLPLDTAPRWLTTVGNIFPLRPFVTAFQEAFIPTSPAPAFEWGKLAIVAAWGIAGALVASRVFRWEPSTRAASSRRSRSRRSRTTTPTS